MPLSISKEHAADLLSKDQERIAYLNFIQNNPVYNIYQEGNSLLIRGRSDRDWVYISSDDKDELQSLLGLLTLEDRNFALVEPWMRPFLLPGISPSWEMSSVKLLLPLEQEIPRPNNNPIELKPHHAQYIYNLSPYKDVAPLDYTRERISRGESAAIFMDNLPVAWAITHDDGAIGFLYVLPEYRSRGFALDVTLSIIWKLREQNKPAFVHIEADNEKSLALSKKLGFVEKGLVSWIIY